MHKKKIDIIDKKHIDEFEKEKVNKALVYGKKVAFIGVPAIIYFSIQDLYIIQEPIIFFMRFIFIIPLLLLSVGVFSFLKNNHKMLLSLYFYMLLSLNVMSLLFNYYAVTRRGYDTNFVHAIITALIVNIFIIFILSAPMRRYLKYIIGLPFLFFCILLVVARPDIAAIYLTYYSNPAIIIIVVIFMSNSQERLEFNEFYMRKLAEDRKEQYESQVIVQKALNEKLETALVENANLNEELRNQVLYDHLTGVYNKGPGLEILEKDLDYCKRNKISAALCYIDIDKLKYVNDNFGHSKGDSFIIEIISSISKQIRHCDYIIRMGGDEFIIIFIDCSTKDANKIILRAKKALGEANRDEDNNYSYDFSYGFTQYDPTEDKTIAKLMKEADIAMYKDKSSKRQ